jgi:hypothetical protein
MNRTCTKYLDFVHVSSYKKLSSKETTMSTLMEQFHNAPGNIEDSNLRHQVEMAYQHFGEIKTEVVGVGRAREMLKPLRERVHAGGIALIADRANVDDLSGTTVMIAADTLQNIIIGIVERTIKASRKRRPLADMLAGLQPVPQAAADFEIDFAAVAPKESDRSRTEFDF